MRAPEGLPAHAPGTGSSGELQRYWAGLRAEICTRCVHGDAEGRCRLDPQLDCALEMSLPFLADTVRRIRTDELQGSLRELRAIACDRCRYFSTGGYCGLAELDCALVRYLPRIAKTIKQISLHLKTGDPQ